MSSDQGPDRGGGRGNAPAVIGLDIGSVTIKGVALDGDGKYIRGRKLTASGHPARQAGELLTLLCGRGDRPVRLGVTGGGKGLLEGLAGVHADNDLVAVVAAATRVHPEARGIIVVGGHQSKWIRLGPAGELESFSLNDQCAAGSGAFLEQQAGRMGMTIDQLSDVAAMASRGATVAGRCAVFAKSDMIHLQQKGTPPAEIAYGLCLALARNFRATLLRGGDLALPAVFIGGGALNRGLFQAFVEIFGVTDQQLIAGSGPQLYEAAGVASAAAHAAAPLAPSAVLEHLGRQVSGGEEAGRVTAAGERRMGLAPLHAPDVAAAAEPRVADGPGPVRAYLGVDVGSVSTDLCLLSAGGEVLDGIYLRTRGDPIGVLREALGILRRRLGDRLEVLGVGTTGSGRHLAGRLLGADVVKNEITCQLLGARHLLPGVDTILEIGGQDSKYVSVKNGRIVDFVMNKICAAGTGSFLEEQGQALGVSIEGQFAEQALASTRPADLGSQCTVFMDAEAVGARQRGARLADVLAGLAYSVAKNYLERVVAGRRIGEQVVFQGGVASNQAVVAAFEQLLGQPVAVHPHNRISGAIGAALAARERMQEQAQPQDGSAFRGLDAAEQVRVRTFECRSCSNMCQVARIDAGGGVAYFGDVCEKFTSRVLQEGSAGSALPDLTGEVEELLESYAGGEPKRGVAGIPRASMMYDLFPFWATFLRSLGFSVALPGRSTMRVLEQGNRRLTAETCLPIKLVYGHVAALLEQGEADFVLLPAVVDIPDGARGKSHLCPFEESVGFMVGTFAAERLVVPTVSLTSSRSRLVRELRGKLSDHDLPDHEINEALDRAQAAQEQYHVALRARGEEALARHQGLTFAVLGKPYNIVDAFENLNLARHLRKLGVLAVPMQMLHGEPVDLSALGLTIPWKYNRDMVQAMSSVARDRRLFPVVVSNFGCGPDAFANQFLERAAGDMPCLLLEFDEHRGEAGLVTRLEAFIDEVSHATDRARAPVVQRSAARDGSIEGYRGRRVVMPHFANHAWAYLGALQSTGADVLLLPPPDEETLAYGEQISSGKECHPYVIIAGDLMKHLDRGTIRAGDVFFFPGTDSACLLHQYGSAMELVLQRKGVTGVEVLSAGGEGQLALLGLRAMTLLGRGLLACDQLSKLKRQVRPYAAEPARVDRLFEELYPVLARKLAEDRLGEALKPLVRQLERLEQDRSRPRPVVGVAGDAYTRVHPFGNTGMFDRLEQLGLEVWPAPFLVDNVEFGWRRDVSVGLDDGRLMDAAGAALLFLRKEWEELRVRYLLGGKVARAAEPGYRDVLFLAAPYVDPGANETVLLNVAKMVHFAENGASGVINAISLNCMLGTVSASLTEAIRADHQMIPITTMMYTGKPSPEIDARLEAFAHQVKGFAGR